MDFLTYLPALSFIAIWPMAIFAISRKSGWGELAKKYRTDNTMVDWQGWKNGLMRGVRYGNCLWISPSAEGLYIKTGPLFFFRPFHPPLLIPWHDITKVEQVKPFPLRPDMVEISLTDPSLKLTVSTDVFRESQRFLGDKLLLLPKKKDK